MQDGATRRHCSLPSTFLQEDGVGDPPLDETNRGDPRELARLLLRAIRAYPAQHHALIPWNQGTGRKKGRLYQSALAAGPGNSGTTREGRAERRTHRQTSREARALGVYHRGHHREGHRV